MRASNRLRAGFTIVELMVATALCLFIMVILTGAFQAGIDTFRQMKAVGNMQEKLRSTTTIIKRDLAAQHFDGVFLPGLQGPYLSDQRLDVTGWVPPDQGFFRVWQAPVPNYGGLPTIIEGSDADGIQSTRAFTHMMHFTVRLPGNRFNELFVAAAPLLAGLSPPDFQDGQNFYSQWAEVAYFLASNGQFANGQPLFTLYRRQRLLLPEALKTTNPGALANANPAFVDVSQYNGANGNFYNAPSDSTVPQRRLQPIVADGNGFSRYPTIGEALPGGAATGDDILMTDVISFEVRATWTIPVSAAAPLFPPPRTWAQGNTDYPFDDLPATGQNSQFNQMGVRVFDTWSKATDAVVPIDYSATWAAPGTPNSLPLPVRVRALQIKLRIWDNKIQKARQVTIIQDV